MFNVDLGISFNKINKQIEVCIYIERIYNQNI